MESSGRDDSRPTPAEELASIEQVRREVAGALVVPPGYDLTAGTAAGLNVAAVGLVLGEGPAWRIAAGIVLLVVALVALGWSVRRFRGANGAWVSGLRAGRTLPLSIAGAGVQCLLGFVAAFAAVAAGWWWLGIVLAPVELVVFVLVSRRWMRVYRAEHGA
ncbi:hypothetical protein [Aeromicrobium yanjiei]|uniref:Uncharacterized protein n=1 Tax=Aeromicrobium yanjiei TaxID=2662028 RepID=A0A5Q2MFM3_9ACTN|nr:hypothetical protein [Aeromicrobium yanjiei]QGG41957.1 hypothetical protein GEV26_11580 [Aeromicrobium yanjiei]